MFSARQGLIDKLNDQFDQMDADGNGFLEPVDLIIITKNKRKLMRGAVTRFHEAHSDFQSRGESKRGGFKTRKFFDETQESFDPETGQVGTKSEPNDNKL